MTFYEITLHTLPKIQFACSVTAACHAETSTNVIDHRKGLLELSYSEEIDMEVQTEWETYFLPCGSIGLFMPDCRYALYLTEHRQGTLTSVTMLVEDMVFIRHSITEPAKILDILSTADKNTFFLPQVSILDAGDSQLIMTQMKSLINSYIGNTAAENLMCLSKWFSILSQLDTCFRTAVMKTMPQYKPERSGSYYYVYKAKKYICMHDREALSLHEIADELKLSPTYLCRIFKAETGQSLMKYIQTLRLQYVRDLIGRYADMKLTQIAAMAGFGDMRYLQRLFKSAYGMTMQRYRQINNGISLYHQNPWKCDHVDHDIYEKESKDTPDVLN